MNMQKGKTSSIDWESQSVLSQIANEINKPLTEIVRLIQYMQNKSDNTEADSKRLSSIMLESSEQIENLIADIMKVEQNKRVEVLVHDTFQFPNCTNSIMSRVNID